METEIYKSNVVIVDEVELVKLVPNWGPLICLFSILLFYFTKQYVIKFIIPPPANTVLRGSDAIWKWTNLVNSLLHSFITGVGSLTCFYMYPRTAADVVSTYSTLSLTLASISTGYFIFDFFDMLINHRKRSSYELMVHHGFVISCFMLCVSTRYYLGFGMVALLVEVNSVFLHWRQLLLLSKTAKSSTYFRFVSLANLATFLVFRIVTLGWMTRWLILNPERVPPIVYNMGCLALTCVMIMSTVLFFRLLRSDHFCSSSSTMNMSISVEEELKVE